VPRRGGGGRPGSTIGTGKKGDERRKKTESTRYYPVPSEAVSSTATSATSKVIVRQLGRVKSDLSVAECRRIEGHACLKKTAISSAGGKEKWCGGGYFQEGTMPS